MDITVIDGGPAPVWLSHSELYFLKLNELIEVSCSPGLLILVPMFFQFLFDLFDFQSHWDTSDDEGPYFKEAVSDVPGR